MLTQSDNEKIGQAFDRAFKRLNEIEQEQAERFCPRHGRASRPVEVPGLRCDCPPPADLPGLSYAHRPEIRLRAALSIVSDLVELAMVASDVVETCREMGTTTLDAGDFHALTAIVDRVRG